MLLGSITGSNNPKGALIEADSNPPDSNQTFVISDAKTLADIPHNFNSCGPAMRGIFQFQVIYRFNFVKCFNSNTQDYLLERALKSYKESYIPGSVFYTTEALNISTRLKYPLSSTTKHLTEG